MITAATFIRICSVRFTAPRPVFRLRLSILTNSPGSTGVPSTASGSAFTARVLQSEEVRDAQMVVGLPRARGLVRPAGVVGHADLDGEHVADPPGALVAEKALGTGAPERVGPGALHAARDRASAARRAGSRVPGPGSRSARGRAAGRSHQPLRDRAAAEPRRQRQLRCSQRAKSIAVTASAAVTSTRRGPTTTARRTSPLAALRHADRLALPAIVQHAAAATISRPPRLNAMLALSPRRTSQGAATSPARAGRPAGEQAYRLPADQILQARRTRRRQRCGGRARTQDDVRRRRSSRREQSARAGTAISTNSIDAARKS